ncbi:phage major capsid protein [Desulfoferula mesophila]|uniref:Phage capsid-like C-terminal domain-containing protein n=1 Tax=Desulfoferula mesophila TaxID=3058419 RepID=A0AAU9EMS6_9BACT|nr:hypothetical protein FAK_15650 [Desulfoferula mesophilus]
MFLSQEDKKEIRGALGPIIQGVVDEKTAVLEAKVDSRLLDLKDSLQNLHPSFSGSRISREDRANLEGLAGLLKGAYRHSRHGDARALDEFGGLDAVMKTDMTEGTGSQGGYTVPTELEGSILRIAEESSLFLGKTRGVSMGSNQITVPALNTPPSVAWHSEGDTITQTSPTLDQVTLNVYRLDAYVTVTNELLEDSRANIANWLAQEFTEAMGKEVDNQIFNGTGTPCSGILTAAAGHSVVMSAGDTNFSAITPTYLSEMMSKMDSTALAGAFFAMNQAVAHYLRTLTDSNGRYLVDLSNGNLWGLPIHTREVCPSSSGAETAFVALCNPRYFLTGLRYGMMQIDMDPYSNFTSNKTNIRVIWRMALNIGKAAAFVRLLTAAS